MPKISLTLKSLFSTLIAVLALVFVQSAFAFPQLSKGQLKRHQAIIKQTPVYEDEKLNEYVTRIGNKMLAQSKHADREYAFVILDSPQVNAFVGGYEVVYIYRGLISILNSEAELAGVIGHEIAHNVLRHTSKRLTRNIGTGILATLSSILVGNSGVGNAILTGASVNESKYGRQAELDSDELGAQYLYKAKYDPEKLTLALSQLNDFSGFALRLEGIERPHHGLRTTHPRTDKRLRKVIEQAGELPPGEAFVGRAEYREALNGSLYGPNFARTAPKGFKRYTNETLGITFVYPNTWTKTLKGPKIVLKDAADTAQMKIEIEANPDPNKTTQELLTDKYPDLVNEGKIHPRDERDLGTIGAAPGQRLALVNVTRNTFNFQGLAKNNVITAEQDKQFVDIIRSFRKMTRADRTSDTITEIYYERLQPGETFASMALESGLKAEALETELRILNGYYPRGEAEPGTWIKKLRKVKIED